MRTGPQEGIRVIRAGEDLAFFRPPMPASVFEDLSWRGLIALSTDPEALRSVLEGEPIVEIRAGDVVWCPPGHKHWHGATPTTSMTHVAIQEALDGKAVEWMEKVSDEQYRR